MSRLYNADQVLSNCYDAEKQALRITTSLLREWAGITADATPTEIFIKGTSDAFALEPNSAISFNLTVGGRDNVNDDVFVGTIKGGIKRDGAGNVSIVSGSVVYETQSDDPAWDFEVQADNVNKSLKLVATGDPDNPVQWEITGVLASVVF